MNENEAMFLNIRSSFCIRLADWFGSSFDAVPFAMSCLIRAGMIA
ncbi:hypothetical protein Q4610_00610 [Sphingobium sp. HBC34]|uniref:Uncharacterized protein n=1 Tax=Sphingobium cyanobacteriorum TaxID=3063954 RepID=A0ABT8ZG73_9SPHN|nr:hypothetical protein [Sphingobium sp. HBC34]MDO7833537.1 hypothetical protein [Sphingobium sp. HBC34]